jgi:hypothetical protein
MHTLTQRSRPLSLPQHCPPADANSQNLRVGLAISPGGSFQRDTAMLTSDPLPKVCRTCLQSKPISEYYRHKKMADGHLNICKPCVCARVKTRYSAEFGKIQAYEKVRSKLPHRKALAKKIGRRHRKRNPEYYRQRAIKHAARHAVYIRAYRAQNPEKYKARCAVNNAVRDGRLEKLPCEVCGSTNLVHGHHSDYSNPLDVQWLCPKHHALVHHPED